MTRTIERPRKELRVPAKMLIPQIHNDLTRRDFLVGGATALLLAGCGGNGSDEETTSTASRTIEHKYGETEIEGTPERIVTVGLTEQDYVISLGITPVGVREWFGGYPGALWPWAEAEIGDDPLPEILPVSELNFEQISTLEADLILGINSGLTEDEYETLSRIAPTVAQPNEYADFGAPWQKITRVTGRALGRLERAEELIPEIEERFERARADHPQFEGSTALLAAIVNDGSFYIYAEGPAPRFLTSLGLEMPQAAAELFSGENRAPVQISLEELDALEADALALGLYGADESDLEDIPVYQALEVVREDRAILMPELSPLNGSLSFGSVLSLPTALDELVPRLAEAVGKTSGD